MAAIIMFRGRPIALDGRQACRLFPVGGGKQVGRWIYAIGFADGRTKLGIARSPRQRMLQHWVASEGAIQWAHLFARFGYREAEIVERRALSLAAAVAERIRQTETFRGLNREAAIRCVRWAAVVQVKV